MAKKSTSRAVKKLQKKIGAGGIILVLLALLIGVGAGAFLAYTMTKNDDFYLTGDSEITVFAGQKQSYASLRGDYYAVSMGKNVRADVVVTPSFEVGADGTVVLEPGVYYISYTLPCLFGTQEVVKYKTITVLPAPTATQGGGTND